LLFAYFGDPPDASYGCFTRHAVYPGRKYHNTMKITATATVLTASTTSILGPRSPALAFDLERFALA
jgi:hypothetical protein